MSGKMLTIEAFKENPGGNFEKKNMITSNNCYLLFRF